GAPGAAAGPGRPGPPGAAAWPGRARGRPGRQRLPRPVPAPGGGRGGGRGGRRLRARRDRFPAGPRLHRRPRRAGGRARRLAGYGGGAGLLLRVPRQPGHGAGPGPAPDPVGHRRPQPRLAGGRGPPGRRGDRGGRAPRPGGGDGRAGRRGGPAGGGGDRVGVLGGRRRGAAGRAARDRPGAPGGPAGRRRPRARAARPRWRRRGGRGRPGRGTGSGGDRHALQGAGRGRGWARRSGRPEPAPGGHRAPLHLRHRPAPGGGGRGPRRAAAGPLTRGRRPPRRAACPGGGGRRPSGRCWPGGVHAGRRGGVGGRPGRGRGGRLGRRLRRARGGGGVLPPTEYARRPVPAAPDRERRGAPARLRSRARHRGGDRAVTAAHGPVLVTGTDTGVGKTVVAAAVAAAATAAGLRVAVVKPAQTGADDDAAQVARLAAPATAVTLATYPDPLAPLVAADEAGLPPLALAEVVAAVRDHAAGHDLVLVEGAGGLLVP